LLPSGNPIPGHKSIQAALSGDMQGYLASCTTTAPMKVVENMLAWHPICSALQLLWGRAENGSRRCCSGRTQVQTFQDDTRQSGTWAWLEDVQGHLYCTAALSGVEMQLCEVALVAVFVMHSFSNSWPCCMSDAILILALLIIWHCTWSSVSLWPDL